jgi:hypothetical protein
VIAALLAAAQDGRACPITRCPRFNTETADRGRARRGNLCGTTSTKEAAVRSCSSTASRVQAGSSNASGASSPIGTGDGCRRADLVVGGLVTDALRVSEVSHMRVPISSRRTTCRGMHDHTAHAPADSQRHTLATRTNAGSSAVTLPRDDLQSYLLTALRQSHNRRLQARVT